MDVRSYASEFLPFSAPIEESWLKKISDAPKVYIIGNGVTAQEYAHILRSLACPLESVSPECAIVDPFSLSDGYLIVACHHERANVVSALESANFIRGEHFETFYRLLRNRAVFDFRGDFDFSEADWLGVISYIRRFQTLGGIDIFVNSNNVVRLHTAIGESLESLTRDFHVKLSIDIGGPFELPALGCFGLDLIELLVRDEAREYFDPSAFDKLCKKASFRNAHVVYIGGAEFVVGDNFSSEFQEHQPSYYDAMLHGHEPSPAPPEHNDNRFCVSRRMYPIFDGKLNLKLCSLFDAVARTNLSRHDGEGVEYVNQRNALCSACRNAGIYRIL